MHSKFKDSKFKNSKFKDSKIQNLKIKRASQKQPKHRQIGIGQGERYVFYVCICRHSLPFCLSVN
jgi:hypothetical protein